MANKLAGQRAKFSRARANFYGASDEKECRRAIELMAEVLVAAPASGFSEDLVTQDEDVPDDVRRRAREMQVPPDLPEEDDEQLVNELQKMVDTTEVLELGEGGQSVYAYGYRCAPDRLKIGSCAGDVIARITAQISTGTPDRPALRLVIKTHDCRALERALHNIFRLRGKQVSGAGAEWFTITPDEVVLLYKAIAA